MKSLFKHSQPSVPKENIPLILSSIIGLVKKRHEQRKGQENNSLIFALKILPFLRNIFEKYGHCVEDLTLKHIKYIRLEKGSHLLKEGDKLESYYIILDGAIEVHGSNTHYMLPEGPHAPRSYSFGEWPKPETNFENMQVVCREKSELAVISHQSLREIINKGKLQKKISFISSMQFSKAVTEYRLSLMINCFKLQKYRRNDVIFSEREISDSIYIVKKGEIKLCKQMSLEENASVEQETASPLRMTKQKSTKNIEFLLLGKGQVFGDEMLQAKVTRQASAVCTSAKASVYRISYEEFKQHFLISTDSKQNLQKFYDSKMKWREDHLHEIKQQSSAVKNKSFENKTSSPPKSIKKENTMSKQTNFSNLESQPQIKALQRQMRLSLDGVSPYESRNAINHSAILSKPPSGYLFGKENDENNKSQIKQSNKRLIRSRNKVYGPLLNPKEDSLKSIINLDVSFNNEESSKSILKKQRGSGGRILVNRRSSIENSLNQSHNSHNHVARSSINAFQSKILKRLNVLNLSTKMKPGGERNSSCSSTHPVNKDTTYVTSLQSLKEDGAVSLSFSMRQVDLFQSQSNIKESPKEKAGKKVQQKEGNIHIGARKHVGMRRYYRSNQTSLGDLTETTTKNTEGNHLKQENSVVDKVLSKVFPMKGDISDDKSNRLHSDILNYQFSSSKPYFPTELEIKHEINKKLRAGILRNRKI